MPWNRTRRTPEKDEQLAERFLSELEECGQVKAACEIAHLPRRTVYEWRDADPEFAAAWDAAKERSMDTLEDEAIRRGRDGVDKPIFQGKERVGVVREYSDTLLMFMLKGARPGKYRERGTEVNVTQAVGDTNLNVVAVTVQELAKEPKYIEWLESRALSADSKPGTLCQDVRPQMVDDAASLGNIPPTGQGVP